MSMGYAARQVVVVLSRRGGWNFRGKIVTAGIGFCSCAKPDDDQPPSPTAKFSNTAAFLTFSRMPLTKALMSFSERGRRLKSFL